MRHDRQKSVPAQAALPVSPSRRIAVYRVTTHMPHVTEADSKQPIAVNTLRRGRQPHLARHEPGSRRPGRNAPQLILDRYSESVAESALGRAMDQVFQEPKRSHHA
jgi:hypothetical protein